MAWFFLSCPPDPSVRCISPGFYAVIGASAMLGGVTRMTSTIVLQSYFLSTNAQILYSIASRYSFRGSYFTR